ncbi:unnamed protein product [Nyctereutes procyonoides]|uniref:TOX high mobility group box family member 4 n=1 Tax=Nyctereutes procyonoides TaxID=34880 RepID=A0A811YHR6_NYCPR|nr:unnamed protein product [Nyctereutes procyonoides]
MEFPRGNDNERTIPFLPGAKTFHTPNVVGHFGDLEDPFSSQDGSFSAQDGIQTLDMPVGMTHGLLEQGGGALLRTQYSANPPVTIDVPMTDMTSGLMYSQLGLSLGGGTILLPAQSPEDRLSTTPSPTSSLHEDGIEDFRKQVPSQKAIVAEAGKKHKAPKKKKKKDPNEPQKPVLAYALFFRDTQAALKGQNPKATFGKVSKIVASMWDSLGEEQKQVYKRKTEAAKKEYLEALAAYKDNQECQTPSPPPMATVDPASPAPATTETPAMFPSIVVNSTLSSYVANQASSGARGQPNITKLITTKQMLPSSITMSQGEMVTVIPATVVTSQGIQNSTATIQPSQQAQIVTCSVLQAAAAAAASMQLPLPQLQPPPLQQMPQPCTQQHKVRINLQQQPPPLQIKIVPPPTLKMQTILPVNNIPEAYTVEETSPEMICEMITDVVPEVESPSQMDVELVSGSPVTLSPQPRCVRSSCENPSIVSKDWDNEYCSNECVVKHCRDVFLAWVASRNSNTVVFVE